jgi:FkbM family methyltransferase
MAYLEPTPIRSGAVATNRKHCRRPLDPTLSQDPGNVLPLKEARHNLNKLKAAVQSSLGAFGYRLEVIKDTVEAPIDLLELVLTQSTGRREDFYFVQIGANDGITDDPIRPFVTKYHWRGLLVEPQPQVFAKLVANYAQEKQLVFENAAIADEDGTVKLYVANHGDATANLTVFASLKKDALKRGLDNPKAAGVQVRLEEVEVPSLSVKTLVARHRIEKIDLLQTDVQGYDVEVVEQFLACGLRPAVIHFEHCHTPRGPVERLYRKLVEHGYRFNEANVDTICLLT